MAWRRLDQGLDLGFTAKGSYEETGGSVSHFMAAIAYGKGVTAAEVVELILSFIREHFATMFKKSPTLRGKLFL